MLSSITKKGEIVRKMDPKPIYFGFWCFDDQHNQIGLMNVQVFVL